MLIIKEYTFTYQHGLMHDYISTIMYLKYLNGKQLSIRTGFMFYSCQEKAISHGVPMEAVFQK